eukprot:SAG11_NODE_13372_length_658_cov_0.828265_3_plen_46_part_01
MGILNTGEPAVTSASPMNASHRDVGSAGDGELRHSLLARELRRALS